MSTLSYETSYTHLTAAQFSTLLATVAASLPGQWTVKEDVEGTHGGNLIRADGLKLWVRAGSYNHKGKVYVRYVRPSDVDGRNGYSLYGAEVPTQYGGVTRPKLEDPSMECTDTKTGEQIARDIARRVLPDAEAVQSAALAHLAEWKAHREAKASLGEQITAVIKAHRVNKPQSVDGDLTLDLADPIKGFTNGYGTVRVNSSTSIDFDLKGITPARALRLAAFLANDTFAG